MLRRELAHVGDHVAAPVADHQRVERADGGKALDERAGWASPGVEVGDRLVGLVGALGDDAADLSLCDALDVSEGEPDASCACISIRLCIRPLDDVGVGRDVDIERQQRNLRFFAPLP